MCACSRRALRATALATKMALCTAEHTCTGTGERCAAALPLRLNVSKWGALDGQCPTRAPLPRASSRGCLGGCAGSQVGTISEALLCYSAAAAFQILGPGEFCEPDNCCHANVTSICERGHVLWHSWKLVHPALFSTMSAKLECSPCILHAKHCSHFALWAEMTVQHCSYELFWLNQFKPG